ncbi:MAG: hypothetical protein OEY24_07645 [Candidatus Bathyarchaeota archaeon]|nr:hypothetical protein [Candidatus Bathyarchaeota archaeon]MDH5495554.1 hypothetical protein [Candidatus Bathyarchaeota archaeon]
MVRDLFKRKKKEKTGAKQLEKVIITDLERICGNDKEIYKALQHTMFRDPRKIDVTMKEVTKKAAELEKKGDSIQARIQYHIAGGLALWKGDIAKVKQYFTKCAELAPEMDYGPITKIPEKGVEKAQEFYKKFLK